MQVVTEIENRLLLWPEVSVHPHRFGAREFRFRSAEIGHVHPGGVVDIPFPRALRDALLDEGLAEEHRWVPNSGWITYRIRDGWDLQRALWLLRLSYLRYALKTAADARALLQHENEQLHLSLRFRALIEVFVPKAGNQDSAQALTA